MPPSRPPSASGWLRRADPARRTASGRRKTFAGRRTARASRARARPRARHTRDAKARVRAGKLDGPILATRCEINPPSQRPRERDLDVRRMDYECLAITSRDPEGRFIVGHSFDARVDYRRYRFTWAKACRPPGEGAARLEC